MTFPCDDCVRPEHCTSRWPDDDKHHPGEVRGCFAEKARSVIVRTDACVRAIAADNQLGKDMDAYKRLRKQGLHPDTIDGSATAEQFDHQHLIERKPDPEIVERYPLTEGPPISKATA